MRHPNSYVFAFLCCWLYRYGPSEDTGGFVENVGLYQQFILKLDLYKFLKNYPALKNSSLHHIILEIILKCLIPLVKTTKNY